MNAPFPLLLQFSYYKSRRIQKIFRVFLSYFVRVPIFKSVNTSSLSKQKYSGGIFSPPRQQLQGQNTSLGIGLIKLAKPTHTLN